MIALDLLGACDITPLGPPCLAGFNAGGLSGPPPTALGYAYVGDDMKAAFAVSHDVNKGLGGILNAVYPGVGTAATGITNMWLDPLQGELTKTPAQGGAMGGTPAQIEAAKKKEAAEKAAAEAMIANTRAVALTVDAKKAADAAASDAPKKHTGMSTGAKAAIGSGIAAVLLGVAWAVLRRVRK